VLAWAKNSAIGQYRTPVLFLHRGPVLANHYRFAWPRTVPAMISSLLLSSLFCADSKRTPRNHFHRIGGKLPAEASQLLPAPVEKPTY